MDGTERRFKRLALALCAALALTGCVATPTDTESPSGSSQPSATSTSSAPIPDLFGRIAEYRDWTPSANYAEPTPTEGPHGDEVRIFMNRAAEDGYFAAALSSRMGGHTWPTGSIIVKEILEGGEVTRIAAMEKYAQGWYWAEWFDNGDPVIDGDFDVPVCVECHDHADTDGTLGARLAE